MPPFLNPLPPDESRTEKRKAHELGQRETSSNKRQATSTDPPNASGIGTRYWMVQWYVPPETCSTIIDRDGTEGGRLNRRNTRHGREMVSSS